VIKLMHSAMYAGRLGQVGGMLQPMLMLPQQAQVSLGQPGSSH
jgi:hypothetical protein